MKLNENAQVPMDAPASTSRFLYDTLGPMARKINALAAGVFAATDGIAAAPPTTGTFAQGDTLRNSAVAELGSPGSKYVVFGWVCVVSGTPGTWLQCRFLTGN